MGEHKIDWDNPETIIEVRRLIPIYQNNLNKADTEMEKSDWKRRIGLLEATLRSLEEKHEL